MTKLNIFTELIDLLAATDRSIDTRRLTLDDTSFRAYGVDSMTLLTLLGKVEQKFDITIEDSEAMIAFSFARLVDLIDVKTSPAARATRIDRKSFLCEVERRAQAAGEQATLTALGRDGEQVVSHQSFLRRSDHLGRMFPVPPQGVPQTVLICATEPLPTLLAFFAALGQGARPLVLPTPKSLGGTASYLARLTRLVDQFGGSCFLAVEQGLIPGLGLLLEVPVVELSKDVRDYPESTASPTVRRAGGDDVAFLQMTSASTGDGKLVAISDRNVCANLTALRACLKMDDGERTFSWLPLYHDMGLLGGALFPLFQGFSTVLMKPGDFIRQPARWIRGISEYRSTFTGAPPFGMEYAARAVSDADLVGVDLSGLRRVAVAAEPIHRTALQLFVDRFAPYGFRPDSLVPGLGLAESTLATTTRVGLDPRYVVVESGGRTIGAAVPILGEGYIRHPAEPPTPANAAGVSIFSLGTALDGLTVQLRSESGEQITDEAILGEITVAGTSVCVGYYDAANEMPAPLPDGLLLTGDLGFFHRGELFVLERTKNVIIRRGVNFLAGLIEQEVGSILGVSPVGTIVLEADINDSDSAIHLLVENAQHLPAPEPVQIRALRELELPIDVVTYAEGFAIPRTTSGKKRYHLCREAIAGGTLDVVGTWDLRRVLPSAGAR
jgi:acyl-CoA synthetase (AMP-forming)/AMP-acid ligase II/acyl carrier protein